VTAASRFLTGLVTRLATHDGILLRYGRLSASDATPDRPRPADAYEIVFRGNQSVFTSPAAPNQPFSGGRAQPARTPQMDDLGECRRAIVARLLAQTKRERGGRPGVVRSPIADRDTRTVVAGHALTADAVSGWKPD
jgi:hypothetical protein